MEKIYPRTNVVAARRIYNYPDDNDNGRFVRNGDARVFDIQEPDFLHTEWVGVLKMPTENRELLLRCRPRGGRILDRWWGERGKNTGLHTIAHRRKTDR